MDFLGLLLDPTGVIILAVVAIPVGLVIAVVTYVMIDHMRERRRANRRHITLRVDRITMSQFGDKFQPVESTSPSEIEALRLKRAIADVSVLDWERKESHFDAILEYRGRTLILTRTKGEFSAQWVVEGLETDYFKRYAVEDMLLVVTILEHGKVAHATVKNPDEFLQYLHLLKNLRSVDIRNIESRWLKTVSRRPTVGV